MGFYLDICNFPMKYKYLDSLAEDEYCKYYLNQPMQLIERRLNMTIAKYPQLL